MTTEHLSLGAEGEAHAAAHLRRRGYRIVERNVRAGGVEIDLIARRGAVIAFVEVKTRSSLAQGPPELAVDRRKQARLLRGAAAWLQSRPHRRWEVRFDVIACVRDPAGGWQLRHIEAAFDSGP